MNRTFLTLLATLPALNVFAEDKPAPAKETPASVPAAKVENPAIVPADRNKEKWWADRHLEKLNSPNRADAKVVFLGDSITQGWEGKGKAVWAKSIESLGALNLGFGGDRTEHVLWRIDNGELDGLKPKALVMLIGTNNVGHHKSDPAQTAEGTKLILARIAKKLPETKVLLLGVLPRSAKPDDALRKDTDEITKLYAPLADGKQVQFLDINAKFLESDGTLSKDIMPDFLHPNEKGYQIWADAMLPKLKEMMN
jgi:lysophospholipase L1-like esterase